jgi:chromosome segregation ATPase
MKIIEIANGRSDARPPDSKSVLEQRLADLEATVRRRQKDWLAARAAASEPQHNLADIVTRERAARIALEQQLAARQARYETEIAQANAVRAMVDEQLREAALEVERARHAEVSASAVVEQLTRAEANAVARLAEREEEFATELSTITATRDGLEQQLSDVESALASARQRHASAATEVERLTRREAELAAQYANEAATRATLERRVADVDAALAEVSGQISRERTVAAERQAMDQALIEQEIARRLGVEERLASALTAYSDAEERHESAIAAAAAVLAERETELASLLAEASAIRSALERRVTDAEVALNDAEQQRRAAMAAAAAQLAERETQFRTELASITATRDRLEEQLRDVEARLTEEAGARAALEGAVTELRAAAAAAEQRFREETATLAGNARVERARLDEQLARARRDHDARLTDEKQQHRSAMATAATRLAEREAALQAELASITAARDALEQQLRDVKASLTEETGTREALERAIIDLRAAAAAAEQRFREETATLAENARAERSRLDDQLSRERHDSQSRLADEQRQHRSAIATAVARLAEREAQFESELAAITTTRDSLERQLRDLEARFAREAESREALEIAIAETRSAAAEAERRFRAEIAAITERAQAERASLETQISRERHDHETQSADERQQHQSAMAAAATRLAEREAELQAELASITATRDSLEGQLRDVEEELTREAASRGALEVAIADTRSAATEAERRFRAEIAAITERAQAERSSLETQISRERRDHETQSADERQQHQSAMATAATRLAEREAELQAELASITATRDGLEQELRGVETRLAQQIAVRGTLEQAIRELRSGAAAAEERFRDETAAVVETARAERTRLEEQLSRERHDHEWQLADEQRQHRSAMATAATRLAERQAHFDAELSSITVARDGLERQLRDVDAKLAQETEARIALARALAEVRSAAAVAERRFRDEIATISENAHAERTLLEDQISRERALADDRLAARGAEFEAELERLSGDHASSLARLQASIAERDSRIEEHAKVSASLQQRLDASEAENRRQFEQTAVPLVRCTRDGAVAGANQAFAALVGCRAPAELRDKDFAVMVFESLDDLSWLLERSRKATQTESVETTCTRRDGTRVAVRLSARPSASGLVEIAAEDLTGIRVLEDRLREAHRMEAVGRLASEIAGTCEKLLNGVYRDAERLLAAITGSHAQRERAETLLDDMTRARGFLSQLIAYGHEQAAALAPVDLNIVLRDLQPVLKRVAGDAIALELRKSSTPLSVDLNAEHVERLLVNVASYGRERMPYGGRLRIELSTVVVDSQFISQYPNVRQGPHALMTVTEVALPAVEGPVADHPGEPQPQSARPGVDLGVLQELISECGGHLWITAEPGGSMVVKMRLPLRAAWESQADSRQGLGRMTARLFGR